MMNVMMAPAWLRVLAIFPLTGVALAVQAQTLQTSTPSEPTALDEVVITGSRSATKLSETPLAIGAVKRAQWDKDKPTTMGEVINRIPGVGWNDLGNEQHSMSIRQPISTSAMYQYLEDGIPIRPLGVFNHNALNEANLNGSDSVEVVKGAASSLYGSNAVGGAVNFLTHRPSRTPTGSVRARIDETDKFARVDTAASNTFGALGLVFSHYSSRRDSVNWQNYSGAHKDAFTVRADYDLGTTSYLRATLVRTDLNAEMTGAVFERDYRDNPGKSINTFTYRRNKATRATLAWEGETTHDGITTLTWFGRANEHGQLPSYTIRNCPGVNCWGTVNNNHVDSVGVDVKHEQKLAWSAAKWISGIYIDRSQNTYVSDNIDIVTDSNGVNRSFTPSATQLGRRDYRAGIVNHALFSQLEFHAARDVRVVLSGRYDAIRYDFENNLTPGANYGAPNETRSFGRFSPKLGATWALNARNSVYSNISGGFKPPEVSELYSRSAIPDLRASTFVNTEVGWRALLANDVKLDTALYQLDGNDTIVSYNINSTLTENRNAGETRSRGLELGLSREGKTWDWRLGWSYADHQYVAYQPAANRNFSGNAMPQAPRNSVNAALAWNGKAGWRVATGMSYQGEYWMDDANTQRYPGHAVFNLNLSKKMAGGWDAWGQIRNFTDIRYSHSSSVDSSGRNTYTPGAPRSLMVGISKTFGK